MGTGLIFAAIVVAWLAYLVPLYLRRQQHDADEVDPREHFSESVRIVTTGSAPLVDQDGVAIPDAEVSTPMTRRAAIRQVRLDERRAATRRRRVVVALMVALTACLGLAAANVLPWWTLAVPGGLVVVFLGIARVTVTRMVRQHDAAVERIRHGGEEATVLISLTPPAVAETPAAPAAPPAVAGMWDPIPVTTPTYVSKPLAPRTVRTIDLSAPDVTSSGRTSAPVLAETAPVQTTPSETAEEQPDHRRAVGE